MSTTTKILATVASVAAVSVAAIGGTYANFTATPTTISNNAFSAGSLTMTRSGTGAILSSAGMKIGETVSGSVTITNTGTLAGAYGLSGSTSGSTALADQLHLVVYKDNDGVPASELYDGPLSGFSSAALGTFAASGGAHTFFFHVDLPTTGTDAGDNAFQGLAATAAFTWSATQV